MSTLLHTRRLLLRPIEEHDLTVLHRWRNDPSYVAFCTTRRNLVGYQEFIAELRGDFARDRHVQLILEQEHSRLSIGMVMSYALNLVDGHVFVTIFLDQKHRKQGLGAEGLAGFLAYLFGSLPLHKIYMEAYSYNKESLAALRGGGLSEEGRFKEHRYFDGTRHDLIRFAVYRSAMDRIKKVAGNRLILKDLS